MQPELPDVTPKAPSEPAQQELSEPSSQHGLHYNHDRPLHLRHEEVERSGPSSLLWEEDMSKYSSPERDESDAPSFERLSKSLTPPGHRIAEYESSKTPTRELDFEEVDFRVARNSRQPEDGRSAISFLPNEILTHVLSHLSPTDLSAVSLVSQRFHNLVTTPHAWRVAFARYFQGQNAIAAATGFFESNNGREDLRSDKRYFTRLTALASWRSEYILRTRLLRSLTRGKPTQALGSPNNSRSGLGQNANAIVMYNSNLLALVNHMHAAFGDGLNKRFPRFLHGADEFGIASMSEANIGKVQSWGLSDQPTFLQFSELFPGDAQWGLGAGDIVGCPNVMDVSQPCGMIYGEGHPGGALYFRSIDEMRGNRINVPVELSILDLGIPNVATNDESICSVWIAKSRSIPTLSEGLVGILSGSSSGIVSSFSLGTDGLRDQRITRGELTAKWVLSPGVPVIAIAVDDTYSIKRQAQNRIWAVALNALGEVFYLTKFPQRPKAERGTKSDTKGLERLAWITGRSVYWNLVEPSRRAARSDPYNVGVDGSYSPRSSWNGTCLNTNQIRAETREVEEFLLKRPKDFQKSCLGWDMQRKLEVDFAGDDGNYAGESVIVISCGLDEGHPSSALRFTRCKVTEQLLEEASSKTEQHAPPWGSELESIFGNSKGTSRLSLSSASHGRQDRRSSNSLSGSSPERAGRFEEWRTSSFSFGSPKPPAIATSAIDMSTYSLLTLSEDPVLGFSGVSTASSPFASPLSSDSQPASPADIPGQRARFLAMGTKNGIIFLWDIRAPVSKSSDFVNTVKPLRIIYTDSPEISCIALTGLYLVHGGNDGLVQAWDPLTSTTQPIRTINSRFSSRARRRLVQAQATPQGVGINMFAAGAICLDPDPTVLRGVVSLGTHLRYWSYSSSAIDQYKGHKRRPRRSERGSNNGGERFAGGGSNNLKHYIANEKYELEREEEHRAREADHLAGRFGIDLLDNEDEAIAYAALLSQETLALDEQRRQSESSMETSVLQQGLSSGSVFTSSTVTPEGSPKNLTSSSPILKDDSELDAEIAEAIRISLQEEAIRSGQTDISMHGTGSASFHIPIRYTKHRKSGRSTSLSDSPPESSVPSSSKAEEMSDLEFALQLSIAEEESRNEVSELIDEFPALDPPSRGTGKGKGKGRA